MSLESVHRPLSLPLYVTWSAPHSGSCIGSSCPIQTCPLEWCLASTPLLCTDSTPETNGSQDQGESDIQDFSVHVKDSKHTLYGMKLIKKGSHSITLLELIFRIYFKKVHFFTCKIRKIRIKMRTLFGEYLQNCLAKKWEKSTFSKFCTLN